MRGSEVVKLRLLAASAVEERHQNWPPILKPLALVLAESPPEFCLSLCFDCAAMSLCQL